MWQLLSRLLQLNERAKTLDEQDNESGDSEELRRMEPATVPLSTTLPTPAAAARSAPFAPAPAPVAMVDAAATLSALAASLGLGPILADPAATAENIGTAPPAIASRDAPEAAHTPARAATRNDASARDGWVDGPITDRRADSENATAAMLAAARLALGAAGAAAVPDPGRSGTAFEGLSALQAISAAAHEPRQEEAPSYEQVGGLPPVVRASPSCARTRVGSLSCLLARSLALARHLSLLLRGSLSTPLTRCLAALTPTHTHTG